MTTEGIIDKIEALNNTIGEINSCIVCGAVGHHEFDEYLNGFVCCCCDVKREIGGI